MGIDMKLLLSAIIPKADGLTTDQKLELAMDIYVLGSAVVTMWAMEAAQEHQDHEDCDSKYPRHLVEGFVGAHLKDILMQTKINCEQNGLTFEQVSSINEKVVKEIMDELAKDTD